MPKQHFVLSFLTDNCTPSWEHSVKGWNSNSLTSLIFLKFIITQHVFKDILMKNFIQMG
jgi:hypothetical protein